MIKVSRNCVGAQSPHLPDTIVSGHTELTPQEIARSDETAEPRPLGRHHYPDGGLRTCVTGVTHEKQADNRLSKRLFATQLTGKQ